MKTLQKILIIGVICFAFIFALASVFLLLQGKTLVSKQLENLTGKKTNIGYIGLTLPLNLEVRKLNIEGLAKVDYASISPSVLGLLSGKIVLNDVRLVRPEFTYEKQLSVAASNSGNTAVLIPASVTTKGLSSTDKSPRPVALAFKRLSIKEGKLYFIDHTVGSEGIKITVEDINFTLTNFYLYPYSVATDFKLEGKIPWQQGEQEGSIEAEGQLNLFKKEMQATLKINDIDAVYLYPYYSQWVDIEKAHIEKAKLNVTSNITGTAGDIVSKCRLELKDVVFKKPEIVEGQEKAQKIISTVMDIFSAISKTNKLVFNFTLKNKMPSFY
ncbi:MAG: DUF748 domain-containing protein [Candidatus Omnitrophica bacterium]|nr:DUF748 domain-containing protein [Candidatus Omnitrophota bacterium]MDD5592796.1 DUF748 domain-containing protein [Candidatus Omnitrophota bacterium]